MKRCHVHVAVEDLEATIRFYSGVFGVPPTVRKPDYAKWMLEDPRINFAVSKQSENSGIDHLGIQVDSGEELAALRQQVAGAHIAAQDQSNAECCYARSDKFWTEDPQGTRWETFHTFGEATTYHAGGDASCATGGAGCTPAHLDDTPATATPAAITAASGKAAGCSAPASGCC